MILEIDKLNDFAELVATGESKEYKGELKVGVDLGTANIVIAVVDEDDNPVAGATYPSSVVKDGIVVDYMGAIMIVKRLKSQIEEKLGVELTKAACAIPPGVVDGSVKAIVNVVEGSGFEVTKVIDEPTAAATVLGIDDGGVVDVGGGTTGISILEGGEVIYTADEATGGTHMTLVISGYFDVGMEEAEELKKNKSKETDVFPIVKPVVQKMADIVKGFMKNHPVDKIYVVGGACSFSEFTSVFEKETGVETIKSNHPLFVTPLGIAMNSVS